MKPTLFPKHTAKLIEFSFSPIAIIIYALIGAAIWIYGCRFDVPVDLSNAPDIQWYQTETTGEEFLMSALEEVESISNYAQRSRGFAKTSFSIGNFAATLPPRSHKQLISSSATDSIYIYGEITTDGYGAVVTERHTYPKGLLLITVRKTHGKPPTGMVTQTKRFITYQDFLNDSTQQSNITEVYGLSSDTILTHVVRNGILETFTFRLPVIRRVTNPQDGSVLVTTRYGDAGAIVSEVRDGNDSLRQIRKSFGASDGGVISYTLYPDSSWRNVRTIGQSDGSVLQEVTSGP